MDNVKISGRPAVETKPVGGAWSEWGPWAQSQQGWGRTRGRVLWPAGCTDCDVKLQLKEDTFN